MKRNIAIFASGEGSNAEAIALYFANDENIDVAVSLSNRKNAFVHQRMSALDIPSFTISNEQWNLATPVIEILKRYDIDFIVLAGFLCIIPGQIIDAYKNRIINIHPSLLPKFGGAGMWGHHVHEAVIASKETLSGITIHYVTNEIDGGEIIFQESCPVMPDDTPESLAARIHELEHKHYPAIIKRLLS